jgi:hypothetical protein
LFKILILVCASSVSAPDCQTNTALDIIQGPLVSSVMACGIEGQAYVAQTSLAQRLDGTYLKIRCDRSRVAGPVVKHDAPPRALTETRAGPQ